MSEDAPVTEQSKIFKGQVFITGGQGIEVPQCFTIGNDGVLLGYDISCGTDVKVPAEINGIKVKEINEFSFGNGNLKVYFLNENSSSMVIYLQDEDLKDELLNFAYQAFCGGERCDLEAIGVYLITNLEEYNNFSWENHHVFEMMNQEFDAETQTFVYDLGLNPITSLDLSDAVYLETIGNEAFAGQYTSSENVDETCFYDSKEGEYYCNGVLSQVMLPQDGVLSTIGYGAFEANRLSNIIIPSTVTSIGDCAFQYNYLSGVLVIPNSVSYIGTHAFKNNNMTEVIIVNSEENVTIGEYGAFDTPVTYNPNYTE